MILKLTTERLIIFLFWKMMTSRENQEWSLVMIALATLLTGGDPSNLIFQLLSSKIVHFDDNRMKLCQITTIPKTNIYCNGSSQKHITF